MNDLDKLYTPSYWSKRLPHDELLKYHENFVTEASKVTRTQIPCQLNIPYGPLNREKLDIFGSDLSDDCPIFAFLHGGYWQVKTLGRESYEFIAEILYKNNIKSIFIGYELCPDVSLPEIVNQIKSAAKYCVEYAKEKESIGLYFSGHSAGGHLATILFTDFIKTLTSTEQDVIKAIISISGVYDLLPIQQTTINIPLKLDKATALEMSPLFKEIVGLKTEFYSVVGENESPEFIKQSEAFNKKLNDLGIVSTFWIIDNVDHFDIIELLSKEDFDLTLRIVKVINKCC